MMSADDMTVVVLAGGRGRRLGNRDKGLLTINGQPLIAQVIAQLAPQHKRFLISANRHLEQYRQFGHPVVADKLPDFPGPLAGIAAALEHCETPLLLCVPCDVPRIPANIGLRLLSALAASGKTAAVAHDGQRLQTLCCLLHRSCLGNLQTYLAAGERKADRWLMGLDAEVVDFSDCADAFANINTAEDVTRLQEG